MVISASKEASFLPTRDVYRRDPVGCFKLYEDGITEDRSESLADTLVDVHDSDALVEIVSLRLESNSSGGATFFLGFVGNQLKRARTPSLRTSYLT